MELYYSLQYIFICHLLQVIFIHYKSRIAATFRTLWWMKMTMVNSGLKGLKLSSYWFRLIMCQATSDNNNRQEGQHMDTLSAAHG